MGRQVEVDWCMQLADLRPHAILHRLVGGRCCRTSRGVASVRVADSWPLPRLSRGQGATTAAGGGEAPLGLYAEQGTYSWREFQSYRLRFVGAGRKRRPVSSPLDLGTTGAGTELTFFFIYVSFRGYSLE